MKRILGFRHIEAIHAIVLSGSVTGAANRLHITQPAVSNILRDAEERLGFPLFVRSGGHLTPTKKADLLFDEIERSFTGLDAINVFCERIQNEEVRHFAVVCTPAFAASAMPLITRKYKAAAPHVFLSVNSRVAHHVAALVSARKADLGFALDVPDVPGVESETIGDLPLVCYLPAGHRLSKKPLIRPIDLVVEPLISLSSVEGIDEQIERAFHSVGGAPQSVTECPAAIAACTMVAAGLGFTLFDALPAKILNPDLVVARPFESDCSLRYKAYWSKSASSRMDPAELISLAKTELSALQLQGSTAGLRRKGP